MSKDKGIQIGSLLVVMLLSSMALLSVVNAQPESNTLPTKEVNLTGQSVVFFNVSPLPPD